MKILITGASGRTTRKTIDCLLARGVRARDLILVSRSPDRPEMRRYAELGAHLRYGDFTDPDTLPEAFAGADRMLLMPMNHPPATLSEAQVVPRVVAIAAQAGITHCVYQWAASVYQDRDGRIYPNTPAPADAEVEAALKQSGMAWTILRTGGFAESLGRECRRFLSEGVIRVADPKCRIGWVSRDDIAEAAATVLIVTDHAFAAYNVVGPSISAHDVAETLARIAGTPVGVEERAEGAWIISGNTPPSDLPRLIGRPGQSALDLIEAHSNELLEGRPAPGEEVRFGFQWQARGEAVRPEDPGLRLSRLHEAACRGEADALSDFAAALAGHPAGETTLRRAHPDWFALIEAGEIASNTREERVKAQGGLK